MAWLTQIARREALRLTQVRATEQFDESSHSAATDDLDALLRRLDVDSALGDLASDERSLIVLRYADDLTYRQVADELGLPVGTAKVRLHRLRARLRARLAETNAS
jgi:RNA polymerase sigma-70 factor (ECF subfamily)